MSKNSKQAVNKFCKFTCICGLVSSLFFSPVFAQQLTIRFGHVDEEDGLSSHLFAVSGKVILQDRLGFYWFGTRDGLNRYDGYQFRTFKHDPENRHSISSNDITFLYEDSLGYVWVGTTNGVNRFDPKTEKFISDWSFKGKVKSILEHKPNQYWLATNSGLVLFNSKTRSTQSFTHDKYDPFSLIYNNIRVLHKDNQGKLWVGTSQGLSRFDEKTSQFMHFTHSLNDISSLSHNSVESILESSDGELWIGTRRGINRYNPKTNNFTRFLAERSLDFSTDNFISSIVEDNQGDLWLGVLGRGVCNFNVETKQNQCYQPTLGDAESLRGNLISALYRDRKERIWVATVNGLDYFTPPRKQFINHQHKVNIDNRLIQPPVISLLSDSNNSLWVGTYGGGMTRYNETLTQQFDFSFNENMPNSLISNNVFSIHEDTKGIIRVGTSAGLVLYNQSKQYFERYKTTPEGIAVIYEDPLGRFWISTTNSGLHLFDTSSEQFERFELPSLSGVITAIQADKAGKTLWLGSTDGLALIDFENNTKIHYRYNKNESNSLQNNFILSLFFDEPNSILWIGTQGSGLIRFDITANFFKQYTIKQGLASDIVYNILKDTDNSLWLSTSFGLSKFSIDEVSFTNFTVDDGLHENDFSHNAFTTRLSGEFVFGTATGFTQFTPKLIKKTIFEPNLLLTNFRVFNQPVPITSSPIENIYSISSAIHSKKEIELTYRQSFFSFEFAVLNTKDPKRVNYAYKLEGWDEYWIETDYKNRLANYTNIPAGNYVLRVKAVDQNGVWKDLYTSISIIIKPPPWKTLWAYIGYMLVALFSMKLIFWLREKYMVQHAKATIDELSGLYSRRYFFEQMTKELNLAKKNKINFAVVFIDLDKFKSINDNFGHLIGDAVIRKAGKRIGQAIRSVDHAGRYGGDEFIIFLNSNRRETALHITKRIRKKLCQTVSLTDNQKIEIEASIGFLWVESAQIKSMNEILEFADKAAYKAKACGGNIIYEIDFGLAAGSTEC